MVFGIFSRSGALRCANSAAIIRRMRAWPTFVFCVLIGLLGCSPGPGANVLLVTVDTLRADYLSSYGFPLETSPNIDALAEGGVIFERAVAASSATAPSHTSIMTSLYTREHSVGFQNGATRLVGARTLASHFQDAGFETAAFVGNIFLRRRLGLDQGFDHYDDELPTPELNRPFIFERIAEETTERVRAWLAGVEGPFFLWVHYQDPHGPYLPPPAYQGRFQLPGDPDEPVLPRIDSNFGRGGVPPYQVLPDARRASDYKSRYADEIFYVDQSIGILLEMVESHAPERQTIVLLTSDHGESLGENDRWFQHGVSSLPPEAHVPLIVRAPGLAPGRRSDLVSHVDVLPTLLELAGLPAAERASGLALGPYLRAGRELPGRLLFCDPGSELSAYRGDSFVRVRPAKDPWGRPGSFRARSWRIHPWAPGSIDGGRPVPEPERAPVDAYLLETVRMVGAAELNAEDLERLRALGYLE